MTTDTSARTMRPRKHSIFGVNVSATTYDEVVEFAMAHAELRQGAVIDFMPVHGLVMAARDTAFREKMNRFDVIAPDGQPVRWALNQFHNAGLSDRVYGPFLMKKLCRAAADKGVGIYLYGSSPDVIEKLSQVLLGWFPHLRIVGSESPPFRPLTPEEDAAAVERINASGAGLVFLGIGCPRQEEFAISHRDSIHAVQLCVGAAFDFHAGVKKMAPAWMQKRGLEWLFRLTQEPGRLWKRYMVTNTMFLMLAAREMLRFKKNTASQAEGIFAEEEESLAGQKA